MKLCTFYYEHGSVSDMPITDPRDLVAGASIEPCIVMGCTHSYGHLGAHDADQEMFRSLQEELIQIEELNYEDTDLGAKHE